VKAILHTQYGPPDLLQLAEVDKPAPKDNEVLIKIHATTVSTGDCNVRNFTFVTRSMRPIAKLMFDIGKPWKPRILGTELAGEVERAGKDVKKFKAGDRIVASTGMAGGGHAQYACLTENGALAIKPDLLNWDEAAALPFGANTALYFLRDLGNIQTGQEVLIIGASGSIGTASVQVAKYFGATVTAVWSGANVEMVTSLGADKVIDYTKEDFTKNQETYDLIFDVVGATTFDRCQNSLKPRGIFLQNVMGLIDLVRVLWTSITGRKKLKGGVAMQNQGRMNFIVQLAQDGKLKPVIDREYPWSTSGKPSSMLSRGTRREML
jgi:NADPH:quinone reductase-like Zn-dependent oxidoreductase